MFSDNFRRGEGKGKGRSGSKAASLAADIGWNAFKLCSTPPPFRRIWLRRDELVGV